MGLSFFKNTVFIPIVIGMVLICFSCGNTFGETNSKYNDGLDNFIDNGKVNQKDSIKEPKIGRLITSKNTGIKTAANLWQKYMPLLKDKKVGIVANQTSVVNDTLTAPNETRVVDFHLVDFIYEFDNQVVKVFAPEQGFLGTADAGDA